MQLNSDLSQDNQKLKSANQPLTVSLINNNQFQSQLREKNDQINQLTVDLHAMGEIADTQEQQLADVVQKYDLLQQKISGDASQLEQQLETLIQITVPNFDPYGLKSRPKQPPSLAQLQKSSVLVHALYEVIAAFKQVHGVVKDKLKQQLASLQ